MRVEEFTENRRGEWDEFLINANNPTIFHELKFFDYHPPERFENRHLMFYREKQLRAILTGAVIHKPDGTLHYVSHSGASYGGFVLRRDSGIAEAEELVDTFLNYLGENHFASVKITLAPLPYAHLPHNHLDFAMNRRGFTYLKRELSSMVFLEKRLEDNFALFRSTARTSTRKAQKSGVEVRENAEWAEFYKILKHNLSMRHNVFPTHTLDELMRLKKLFPERIRLFGAFHDDVMAAGTVLFLCNERAMLAFYISHREDMQDIRPLNLLFYEVMRFGIENGFALLDFGTYTLDMEPNYGLAHFKEGFGARGVFRDTLTLKL